MRERERESKYMVYIDKEREEEERRGGERRGREREEGEGV